MNKPIHLLQNYLKKNKFDIFLVPRTDEYLNEYVAPYAERLRWVSNFSGSAGIAVILQKKAAIFTDGRYKIQIKNEVNKKLFSIHDIKDFEKWIKKNVKIGCNLAIDPWLFSKRFIEKIKRLTVEKKTQIKLLESNPIDTLWSKQPIKPTSKLFLHGLDYAGKSSLAKLNQVKNILKKQHCDYFVFTALDSIAWILNLRGSDIEYTPLNFLYLILSIKGKPRLYVNLKKISPNILSSLSSNVNVFPYEDIKIYYNLIQKNAIVGVDENRTPYWFINQLNKQNIKIKVIEDPCYKLKAIKNSVELRGARNANLRDGISLTKFLYWLKQEININKVSEIIAAKKLLKLRKNNKLFFSLSFDTISAFGSHAALPHYRVTKNSNSLFTNNAIYLVDSGAQYFDGTTDITRTIILGNSTHEQKDRFTRVLKGHIALAQLKFSNRTRGSEIDYVARQSLKEIGCDYDHGTGHGIGSFLSVHEGPQRIFKSLDHKDEFLKAGMIISNEPGYYKPNKYGIRIENLVVVKKVKNGKLGFDTISWAPIDKELILIDLLNTVEKKWLNDYHKRIYKNLHRYLSTKEKLWLKKVTQPL